MKTIDDALAAWPGELAAAAQQEGWDLFDSYGDVREIRVERIDDPDEVPPGGTYLSSDSAAWKIVREGTASHHVKAREILQEASPDEWARVSMKGKVDG